MHIMKIISGRFRGISLYSPKRIDTRPALARMRNSLFNILAGKMDGKRVIDLFAGTGSIGFEALSRGAGYCLFVENNRTCLECLRKNISRLNVENQTKVLFIDAFNIISYPAKAGTDEQFDYIFIDPPYKYYDIQHLRDKLFSLIDEFARDKILSPEGMIIVEHRTRMRDGNQFNNLEHLERVDLRNYGQTSLSFLIPKAQIS
jgi:16S rRNA (guanine(966)-N(2))-methyltransferase RsmD